MGDLSKNFSRLEFACKCGCGKDVIDYKVVVVLEMLREKYGSPVRTTSATRCEDHNKYIGGSENSQHLKGKAVDFVIDGQNPRDVANYLNSLYPSSYGVGSYDNFTHFDSRSERARWGF